MTDRRDILDAILAKYGVPKNRDEIRFERTKQCAETLAAQFPAEGWGLKVKPSTGVVATDILATRSPFELVDIFAGDGNPESDARPIWEMKPADPNDSAFVPVTAHDWLASEPPVNPPPVDPPPPTGEGDLAEMLSAIRELRMRVAALEARPSYAFAVKPSSTGRAWGHSHSVNEVTVKP